ncbi:DHA2 family efflux MFS transporter permease subunit [Burkholderia vietnamiensis]|jgi:EmrB/QacA subfamily drug resistance transporter|uniref:DHA2 family efflux MFS transporter permease subunit n=1 Tax=Burkholderia vietnamiensis TaxID=60552 RepID=UPI00075D7879|nr:DHA2 family efflux MFS transporter permease subunit [Burkholderia vietnamiensis]KVE03862.1 disulfide bond formation protein DsbA [Burkholderia vietnamiensis]KVE50668.1 disulfide bond formation protein DsbA [Burkholderia vietnamiensis]KVE89609.1 disulfide bond formation protein DsbA [Burkholderia vietnamiensis]KVG07759.1 disulfide bond formation protein DsbA [Burkholderia vietnamiensis]KVR82902.1 disulfide bond formation protein DsbA [Burkholderia vietnamiensis]
MTHGIHGQQRWYALIVLCLGVLMIVLDSTIVNVALPSIGADLHFTGTALVWVVNAYLLTFGGCLLLGGRLGDLYGQRRMFLAGLVVFTLASLACGVAPSQTLLIAARAVQGFGGAVVSAVSLSLIMNLFTEPGERARAMGVYGFVCAGGGSLGVLLGGLLTSTLSWHWIFLVNLPIGIAVYAMCVALLPRVRVPADAARLDVAGALTVTASLMLAVYGIVGGNEAGWLSPQTVGLIGAALALLAAFIAIEARVAHPLMPLTLFAARNVALANVIGVLWAAAMFAWFFLSALYMQRVLGYGPLQVGLAFLPANLIMAAFSLGLSARIVMRCGIRGPIAAGLLIAACGLALFSRAPVDGGFVWHVLPGMTLLGIGAGVAFNPVLLAAMSDVEPADSGLASGIVNTAFMMGGALGLAVLASLAAARTETLAAARAAPLDALNGGYHAAFAVGAAFAAAAGLLGLALRIRRQDAMPGVGPAVH